LTGIGASEKKWGENLEVWKRICTTVQARLLISLPCFGVCNAYFLERALQTPMKTNALQTRSSGEDEAHQRRGDNPMFWTSQQNKIELYNKTDENFFVEFCGIKI